MKYKLQSCFSYSDDKVASGSEDGKVYVWDLVDTTKMQMMKGHSSVSCSLAYHPREHYLLSGSADGTIVLWDLQQLKWI